MKSSRIPYTFLSFDLPIYPSHLRAFRGAIIESVMSFKSVFDAAQIPTDVFHNHTELVSVLDQDMEEPEKSTDTQFRYPLIQYKIKHRKAAILGIGQGAQALQLWTSLAGDHLKYQGREVPLDLTAHQHISWIPLTEQKTQLYRLNKWLPFNSKHYKLWKETPKLADKAKLLDKLLWGNLFQLLDSVGATIDRKSLELFVSSIDMATYKDSYGIKRLALDITFSTNLNLPDEIGLGQGISAGFGKVQKIKN